MSIGQRGEGSTDSSSGKAEPEGRQPLLLRFGSLADQLLSTEDGCSGDKLPRWEEAAHGGFLLLKPEHSGVDLHRYYDCEIVYLELNQSLERVDLEA